MAEMNSSTVIVCCACGETKTFEEFPKLPTGKYGRNTKCKPCMSAYQKKYRADNKERLLQAAKTRYSEKKSEYQKERREHYQANKEAYKANAKKWASENPEKRRQVASGYVKRNPEKRSEQQKIQREKNPGYYRAHFKMRQARKRQALSTWADLEAIEAIYRQCSFVSRFTGIKHHVDHYYPLKSDLVCGLHNQHNLRIVPATVNLSKGNKFPE